MIDKDKARDKYHRTIVTQPIKLLKANEALVLDPHNCKAQFRKAKSLLMQGHMDVGYSEMRKALTLEPKNVAIRKELRAVKTAIKKRDQAAAFRKETEEGMKRMKASALRTFVGLSKLLCFFN